MHLSHVNNCINFYFGKYINVIFCSRVIICILETAEVLLMQNNDSNITKLYEQAFQKMYVLNSIITLTRESCEERENKGVYYGLKSDMIKQISDERYNYINALSVASEIISNIMSIYVSAEYELNQNTYNCGR